MNKKYIILEIIPTSSNPKFGDVVQLSALKINNLKLIGNVPSNSDEIIVNKFFADYMIENGITIYDYDKDKKLNLVYFGFFFWLH